MIIGSRRGRHGVKHSLHSGTRRLRLGAVVGIGALSSTVVDHRRIEFASNLQQRVWFELDPVASRLADGEQGRPEAIEMAQFSLNFSEGHTRPRLDRSAPFFRVGPLSAALLTVPPRPVAHGRRKYAKL